jgi:acetyl esterase/lipase
MTRRALLATSTLAAQDILTKPAPKANFRIPYGTDPLQFGDLRLPDGKGPFPLVINIHGGFWRAQYDLEHNGHLCEALRLKGIATWSIEYRRVGNPGGGWPGTFNDVKAAAGHVFNLVKQHPINPARTITMGHSAGGQLALYAAFELPWISGAISLAGVNDLRRAHELKLGREQVKAFLGGTPEEVTDRYRIASPIERIPLGRPAVLIHGTNDAVIPFDISTRYTDAAGKAGDKVILDALPGGHFELIDPASSQWATVEKRVLELTNLVNRPR